MNDDVAYCICKDCQFLTGLPEQILKRQRIQGWQVDLFCRACLEAMTEAVMRGVKRIRESLS